MRLSSVIERAERINARGGGTAFAGRRHDWTTFADRVRALAGGLRAAGLVAGDRVALTALNSDRARSARPYRWLDRHRRGRLKDMIVTGGENVFSAEVEGAMLIALFKCPKSIAFRVDPLPVSAVGKVLKADLRRASRLEPLKEEV